MKQKENQEEKSKKGGRLKKDIVVKMPSFSLNESKMKVISFSE